MDCSELISYDYMISEKEIDWRKPGNILDTQKYRHRVIQHRQSGPNVSFCSILHRSHVMPLLNRGKTRLDTRQDSRGWLGKGSLQCKKRSQFRIYVTDRRTRCRIARPRLKIYFIVCNPNLLVRRPFLRHFSERINQAH